MLTVYSRSFHVEIVQLENKLLHIYILNMKHHLITQEGQNVNQSFCTGKKAFKNCFIWMHILKFEVPKRLLSMCKTFLLLVYKVWGINFTFRSLFTTLVNQGTKIFLDLISVFFSSILDLVKGLENVRSFCSSFAKLQNSIIDFFCRRLV